MKITYFIIAWIPWAGDLPTAKVTKTTHEKSLASGISLGVLIGGSQWGGGIYGYRLKFWLFYGYRVIFFQLRLTLKLKINFFVSKS